MASRTKKLEQAAGTAGFAVAERAFLHMDPLRAERAGIRLGMLFYRVSPKRRRIMHSNLRLAMPELSEDERTRLAMACARHFGKVFADFLRSSRRTNEEVRESCPLLDRHLMDEALAKGKGAILITGHYGNWERAAHAVVAGGYKVTVVARDANGQNLNDAVLRIRRHQGIEVLSRGNAARGILRKLAANEVVAILPDQNSGDIFVPFFGKPCGTVTGPASIHVKTGCPVLALYSRWVGPARYEARFYPELQAVPGYDPVEGMTRAINNSLEAAIREAPEQWLWFHDRWKSARRAGLLD
ncbi:MAG TPA: lysophospholipid acyltransferase family protein [Fimbriimonadaceae bacterium]|nr:lysophospholipid acyltransferase family protein [Fimbriimonadaceae bacterium]